MQEAHDCNYVIQWNVEIRFEAKVFWVQFNEKVTYIPNFKYLCHSILEISWSREFVSRRAYSRTHRQIHTKNSLHANQPESNLYTKFQVSRSFRSGVIVMTRIVTNFSALLFIRKLHFPTLVRESIFLLDLWIRIRLKKSTQLYLQLNISHYAVSSVLQQYSNVIWKI